MLQKPRAGAARPWLYFALLASINLYICGNAFVTPSSGHWSSIHGQWLALARIAGMDWLRPNWWPYWGGGAPLESTYAPLIPVTIAALMRLFHCSPEVALNLITGLVYCLGPLGMYLLSWKLTRLPGFSFAAALAWSLMSPAALLLPDQRFQLSSLWSARRLYLIFDWDDLPHLTSITLLPLAVWFLARALQSRRPVHYAITALAMAGMMLANMFGAVLALLVVITVSLALETRFRPSLLLRAAIPAAAAYLLASPWLPPSLLMTIRANEAGYHEVPGVPQAVGAFAILAGAVVLVWKLSSRHIGEWPGRWMLLFGSIVILIPALSQYGELHFLPQPARYKIEAEAAILWIVVFGLRPLIGRLPYRVRFVLAIPLVLLAARQTLAFRNFADGFTQPVNVRQSIEYRSAKWVERNLPGQRVMMAGSMGNFLDTFTELESLSAQPYTTAPNWEEQIAMYTIYRGENAGDRDAEYSLLWLKAFGAQAIGVPGPKSPEAWKPFARPHKFEGFVPVLWREDDTTIYKVPQKFVTLAHIMPPGRLVQNPPIHGLDTSELRRYTDALDTASRPATLEWQGSNRVRIRALLNPGEIVSIQINYHRGWHATNGSVRADGIGLMVVDPKCSGDCRITLDYDGGVEARLARIASGGTMLVLLMACAGPLLARKQ